MVLLGLNGRAGSGKDTAFLEIQKWAEGRGVRAVRRGFADALKLSAYRIFKPDCTLADALEWCDKFKNTGSYEVRWYEKEQLEPGGFGLRESLIGDGREFLQRFGTEAHRDVFGKDFWVDALLPTPYGTGEYLPDWESNFDGADIAVITDVRFANEAERIKELGGYIWKIDRPLDTIDRHASEQELPPGMADLVIDNSGTLDEFLGNVSNALSDHFHFDPERAMP